MNELGKLACTAAVLLWLAGCGGGGGGSVGGSSSTGGSSSDSSDVFSRMESGTTTSASTGAVSGTVTDAGGQALAEATVTCTSGGDSRAARQASFSTVTDESGQYAIGNMSPGSYTLIASHEGVGDINLTVNVQAGQVQQNQPMQCRPGDGQNQGQGDFQGGPITDPGVILGRVEDLDGQPIARARLSISDRLHAATGDKGVFAFPPLEEGEYLVVCRAEGYEPAQQTANVVAGEATRLIFQLVAGSGEEPVERASVVGGTVIDRATQEPLAGVKVSLEQGRAEVETGDDGAFLFTDVRPGGLLLSAAKEGYVPYREALRVPAASEVRVTIVLVAKPTDDEVGALALTILDAETQEAILGAVVTVDGRGPFKTDDAGLIEIGRVPAGDHNLTVAARGYQRVHDVLTVAAGETTEHTYELTPEAEQALPDAGPNGGQQIIGPGGSFNGQQGGAPAGQQGTRPGGQQPGGQQPGGQQPGGQQPGGQQQGGQQPGGQQQGNRPGGQQPGGQQPGGQQPGGQQPGGQQPGGQQPGGQQQGNRPGGQQPGGQQPGGQQPGGQQPGGNQTINF